MRLWLDDARDMPDTFNIHARTASEAIAALSTGRFTEVSLDHDLGPEETCGTGYDVACYLEDAARTNAIPPVRSMVHSANPVGRERMKQALTRAKEYWDSRGFNEN